MNAELFMGIRAENIRFTEGLTTFNVVRNGRDEELQIHLRLPGIHNVRNALAAIAVAGDRLLHSFLPVRGHLEYLPFLVKTH